MAANSTATIAANIVKSEKVKEVMNDKYEFKYTFNYMIIPNNHRIIKV